MKASEFLKAPIEAYREQVSGGGVKVEITELGIDPFWVFPVQPGEIQYINHDLPPYKAPKEGEKFEDRNHAEDAVFYFEYCIRQVTGRAKKENGHSIFDTPQQRDLAAEMMRTSMPDTFSVSLALDIINRITNVYPTTSVEEAEKNSTTTT